MCNESRPAGKRRNYERRRRNHRTAQNQQDETSRAFQVLGKTKAAGRRGLGNKWIDNRLGLSRSQCKKPRYCPLVDEYTKRILQGKVFQALFAFFLQHPHSEALSMACAALNLRRTLARGPVPH